MDIASVKIMILILMSFAIISYSILRNQEFSVYFLVQDHSRGLLLMLYQNTCLLRNSYVNWQEQRLCHSMIQHLLGLKPKPYQSRLSTDHFFLSPAGPLLYY